MKANHKNLIYIGVIILFIFNIISYVLPIPKSILFWTAYLTMTLSLGVAALTVYNWIKSNETLKSKFLSLPLMSLVYRYVITQFILSIGLYITTMMVDFESLGFVYVSILISAAVIIINLVFAIQLLFTQTGINLVNEVESKVIAKVNFIQSLHLKVEILASKVEDKEVKKALNKLSENLRFSDPMSHESLQTLELKITDSIHDLSEGISDSMGSIQRIKEIELLLKERNKKCKLLK